MKDIVLCSDEGFAVPLAVTLRSLMDALSDASSVSVTVLSFGITKATELRIKESAPDLSIEFLPLEDVLDPRLAASGHLPLAAYGRIFAPSIVQERTQRILYLDADLLIVDDVATLFDQALGDSLVAAVPDQAAPIVSAPGGLMFWRELGLSPTTPCLNSGVLLINTAAWTALSIEQRVAEFLDRYADRIRWADQDALNGVLAGNFSPLACRWNQQSVLRAPEHLAYAFFAESEVEAAVADPAIVHFTAGAFKKPWKKGVPVDPAADQWLKVLRQTRYADYRPPTPSLTQRLRYARTVTSRRFNKFRN